MIVALAGRTWKSTTARYLNTAHRFRIFRHDFDMDPLDWLHQLQTLGRTGRVVVDAVLNDVMAQVLRTTGVVIWELRQDELDMGVLDPKLVHAIVVGRGTSDSMQPELDRLVSTLNEAERK